jgi:death-on-curing protein
MKAPRWLTVTSIRIVQDELNAEHRSSSEVADLVETNLSRQPNLLAYGKPSISELAASYAFCIVCGDPFVNGDKRTALMAAYVFLSLNGQRLVAPEAEAVVMMRELASGACGEPEFAAWLSSHLEPMKGRH